MFLSTGSDANWRLQTRQVASQRATPHHQPPTATESQQSYRPFSSVPDHIKRLIYEVNPPQGPYINPQSFFYGVNVPAASQNHPEFQTAPHDQPEIKYRTDYPSKTQTIAQIRKKPFGIKSREEDSEETKNLQNSRSQLYSRLYQEMVKRSPEENVHYQQHQVQGHGSMPPELQMILHWQSQIPYNVLANEINFQSKKPFIPRPLPDEIKNSAHSYPTKMYYIKSDGEILDNIPSLGVGPFKTKL